MTFDIQKIKSISPLHTKMHIHDTCHRYAEKGLLPCKLNAKPSTQTSQYAFAHVIKCQIVNRCSLPKVTFADT